jgi:hypothetical protein
LENNQKNQQEKKMSVQKRPQIDFIMNQKKQGKTYGEIALAFAKKFGISKSVDAIRSIFRNYQHEYDLDGLKSVVEVKAEIIKEKLVNDFLDVVQKRKYVPIQSEFTQHIAHTPETIKKYFGNFDGLVQEAKNIEPKVFENIIDDSSFTDENFKELRNYISKHKRFVITSAITGCEPHLDALKAIETFCKHNKAALLILPCSDPATSREHKSKWSLSHKLPKESIVFKDVSLNDNLVLSTIKMSAKQLQPLTGLKRIGQKKGSTIFSSPKQFLEFAANSNNNSEIHRALMTTGAITRSDYRTEMYMSERTGYLADQDHTLGAIIVEIKNGRIFFFRQVQFEPKTGAFCDLDKKYHANGKVEKITAELIQLGDYHVLSTDPQAKKMAKDLAELLKPDYMTLEDFLDGITINPHERHNLVSLSKKSKDGLLSLDYELKSNAKEINELCQWPVKQLVFKYGNHEDFLNRWLCDGAFINEPQNKILGMKLTIALEELGVMPFEYAMREIYGLQNPDKVKFLDINDSFKINGIENGAHGHLGKGGRRNPSMGEIEECYGACNVGHNHSAAIFRSVYRVGTSTYLQLSYNNGPSAWSQTHLIQHRNGSRQLVHNIYGEFRLKD